jgi:hypothetical protein
MSDNRSLQTWKDCQRYSRACSGHFDWQSAAPLEAECPVGAKRRVGTQFRRRESTLPWSHPPLSSRRRPGSINTNGGRNGGTVCASSSTVSVYGSRAPLRGPGMTPSVTLVPFPAGAEGKGIHISTLKSGTCGFPPPCGEGQGGGVGATPS